MFDYLIGRLSEKSTWFGGATAISALCGFTIPDEKIQAAFVVATFVLGCLTAGTKDKGARK